MIAGCVASQLLYIYFIINGEYVVRNVDILYRKLRDVAMITGLAFLPINYVKKVIDVHCGCVLGMEILYEKFHNQDADQIFTYSDTIYVNGRYINKKNVELNELSYHHKKILVFLICIISSLLLLYVSYIIYVVSYAAKSIFGLTLYMFIILYITLYIFVTIVYDMYKLQIIQTAASKKCCILVTTKFLPVNFFVKNSIQTLFIIPPNTRSVEPFLIASSSCTGSIFFAG
ncbi:hypothetical protein QTP88_006848 [Uroleucon formosanum]